MLQCVHDPDRQDHLLAIHLPIDCRLHTKSPISDLNVSPIPYLLYLYLNFKDRQVMLKIKIGNLCRPCQETISFDLYEQCNRNVYLYVQLCKELKRLLLILFKEIFVLFVLLLFWITEDVISFFFLYSISFQESQEKVKESRWCST